MTSSPLNSLTSLNNTSTRASRCDNFFLYFINFVIVSTYLVNRYILNVGISLSLPMQRLDKMARHCCPFFVVPFSFPFTLLNMGLSYLLTTDGEEDNLTSSGSEQFGGSPNRSRSPMTHQQARARAREGMRLRRFQNWSARQRVRDTAAQVLSVLTLCPLLRHI